MDFSLLYMEKTRKRIHKTHKKMYKTPIPIYNMPMEKRKRTSQFSYIAISEEDEKWQFVCTNAGASEIAPSSFYPPNMEQHPQSHKSVVTGRILNEYQLIYITKGKGILNTNSRDYEIIPGTIFMVFPGIYHAYKPIYEIGWTEYWVGFRGAYIDILKDEGFFSPEKPIFYTGLQNSLIVLFSQILDQVRSQKPFFQLKASSYVLNLIAEILSIERNTMQHSHSEHLVHQAKFFMEQQIYGEINLNSICDQIGVSTSHLNEVFKNYTGMTPYQYYISIKILKAKELLERQDQPIKEIAFRLGFNDQYYFSRLFKKKTGISPSNWISFLYQDPIRH